MRNFRFFLVLGFLVASLTPSPSHACKMTPYGLAWHELKALIESLGNPPDASAPIHDIFQQGPDMWVVEKGEGKDCLGELFNTRLTGADCTIEVQRVPTFAPIQCRKFTKKSQVQLK